jgi:hypothetical protein
MTRESQDERLENVYNKSAYALGKFSRDGLCWYFEKYKNRPKQP